MKTILFYSIIFLALITGCKETEETIDDTFVCCGYPLPFKSMIYISFVNEAGEDLLDSETQGHFDADSFKIYYSKANELIPASNWYTTHFDLANSLGNRYARIYHDDSPKTDYIRFFLSWHEETRDTSVAIEESGDDYFPEKFIANTYLKLSATDTDTITSTIWTDYERYLVRDFLYNGKQIDIVDPNYITVVK